MPCRADGRAGVLPPNVNIETMEGGHVAEDQESVEVGIRHHLGGAGGELGLNLCIHGGRLIEHRRRVCRAVGRGGCRVEGAGGARGVGIVVGALGVGRLVVGTAASGDRLGEAGGLLRGIGDDDLAPDESSKDRVSEEDVPLYSTEKASA